MLKKLKTIWKNRKEIFEGFRNRVFYRPMIEEVAYNRMEICIGCDDIDYEGDKCMIPGTAPCCGVCGCKLSLKLRSLASECPHPDGPKWKAHISEEEQDALYKSMNYDPDKEKDI